MEDTEPGGAPSEGKTILPGQEGGTGARGDFISSLILVVIGVGTIIESLRMPKFENWGFYTRPNLPPIFFASCLILASGIIFLRSIRNRGHRLNLTRAGFLAFCRADATRRFSFVVLMVVAYLSCLGLAHFVVVSTGFLFLMMLYFRGSKWWVCLLVAFLASFFTWFLFEKVFLVSLP